MRLGALFLVMFLCCGCGPKRAEDTTFVRYDHEDVFAPGTAFAIARQSYPNHRSERIPTIERKEIIKIIDRVLRERGFAKDQHAKYVISFHREYFDFEKDGDVVKKVKVLLDEGETHYMYELNAQSRSNDRDGALVIDVINKETNTLERQVVSLYYFGKLQAAYRESPDDEKEKYRRGIVALEHMLGLDVTDANQ